jgi:hypothetical protein
MRYDRLEKEYVTLCLGGPEPYSPAGERLFTFASSVESAQVLYRRALLEFLGANRHIIWRTEPEVERADGRRGSKRNQFAAYSRLTAYPEAPPQNCAAATTDVHSPQPAP